MRRGRRGDQDGVRSERLVQGNCACAAAVGQRDGRRGIDIGYTRQPRSWVCSDVAGMNATDASCTDHRNAK
jgi:hypothetical protein